MAAARRDMTAAVMGEGVDGRLIVDGWEVFCKEGVLPLFMLLLLVLVLSIPLKSS